MPERSSNASTKGVWWAGPIATSLLSMLGADVIHVEHRR